jgi:hypothetical protein
MHLSSRTLITRISPLALALAAVLAMPSAASAQTGSIPLQSGTACVPNRGDTSKVNYSSQWGIYNDNTSSSAKVYCPVVYSQDEFEGALNGNIEFWVYDQNGGSGKDVSCTLYSLNMDGSVGSSETHATSGSSSFAQVLGFDFGSVFGTYNAQCTLPASSNGKQSRVTSFGAEFTD